jgi:hypothetical protein
MEKVHSESDKCGEITLGKPSGDILVKCIILNTDIFDEEIGTIFYEVIDKDLESFDKEKVYKLTVSFHTKLWDDPRAETFSIPKPEPSGTFKGPKKISKEHKMYEVMHTQLERIDQILNKNGIKTYSTTIQGDYLESDDIMKIEIYEDITEPEYRGKGKNRKRVKKGKTSMIVPNSPGLRKHASNLATDRIIQIYKDFMKEIRDKKLMAEILGIEETQDEVKLVMAFAEQYGDLWLTTREQEKELLNRFKERGLFVLNKYIDKEEKPSIDI